ncbi:MAG: band 7 protein [Deltaproteobacteria bacterium RBG_16_71_12]|nr:MAG: band 7 protein [Deltaproteobacteria bacterium RBG_16_71_12]
MADITSFLFARHLRVAPTSHVLFYKDGALKRSGKGLAFWFMPLGASISVVPLDDREQAFLFKGRSADFQEVTVNGVVVYRVKSAEELAGRVDFAVDSATGAYTKEPLERLAAVVTQLAQQLAATWLGRRALKDILLEGPDALRAVVHDGLVEDGGLLAMGLEIVATRVASVAPTSEMEKALQMPTRESIQQQADQATFARRALAVEKERAIQENELHNQIELAKREETLIAQRGQNDKKRAIDASESKRIEAEGAAGNVKINAEAQAESIRVLEEVKVTAEKERMDIYRTLPPAALMGLAARELAGKLQSIEHLNLSPDLLGSLLERVLGAQARKLEADAE